MITKWKVFNFKSIREETELEFGPLTIFAGANSSGKSSFIQSVLLVAQTLAHKVSSRSVVLNGMLANLGQFDDLKSNDSESDHITIRCTFEPLSSSFIARDHNSRHTHINPTYSSKFFASSIKEISCEISFGADSAGSHQYDPFQIQPRLSAVQLLCVHTGEDENDHIAEISIEHNEKANPAIDDLSNSNEKVDQLTSGLTYTVKLDDNSLKEIRSELRSAKPTGCTFKHFLPQEIIFEIDEFQEAAKFFISLLAGNRFPNRRFWRSVWRNWGQRFHLNQEAIAVLDEIFEGEIEFKDPSKGKRWDPKFESLTWQAWSRLLSELPSEKRSNISQKTHERKSEFISRIDEALKTPTGKNSNSDAFVELEPPSVIIDATEDLEYLFTSSFNYLGPLRDSPKSLYPLAPAADPNNIGLRGEYTAFILETHKNKEIRYLPSANFKSSVVDRKTERCTLENAVIDWLQYLNVASSIETRDQGKLGHELKVGVSDLGNAHDLMHVGVGVSQVLPILVTCFLADSDTTLVFEQPELHLHPKVQTLLGDFFLSIALSNKQCLVETHSEYLIDRLRYRIAAAPPEEELHNQTKIYFVELKSGRSDFREVTINEYGAIIDWPEGFFDQSQQQAEDILRAAVRKRKTSRKTNDG